MAACVINHMQEKQGRIHGAKTLKKRKVLPTDGPTDQRTNGHSGLCSRVHMTKNAKKFARDRERVNANKFRDAEPLHVSERDLFNKLYNMHLIH